MTLDMGERELRIASCERRTPGEIGERVRADELVALEHAFTRSPMICGENSSVSEEATASRSVLSRTKWT